MRPEEVIDAVYSNLTKLAMQTKGKDHSLVVEITTDLDRMGLRRLLGDLSTRGRIIKRLETQLGSRRRTLSIVTRQANSFEYLTTKLADENAGLVQQLQKNGTKETARV